MKLSQIIERYICNPSHKEYNCRAIPFQDFDLEQGEKINEELFLKFIGYTHNDRYCYRLFMDTAAYLINQENVTDMVLTKLLRCISLSKFSWLKVDLCHAQLDSKHAELINKVILEPACYY